MLVKHVDSGEVGYVIVPELGETITVRHDYQPWLLGFCRWAIMRQTHTEGGGVMTTYLRTGKWHWRGIRARYTESLV